MGSAALLCLIGSIVGCGDGGSHLSGTVKFKGQPVPSGTVMILPDGNAGNSGASGFATIKDGVFDTSKGGRPSKSGAVVIRIDGIDPNPPPGADPDVTATPLFTGYELKMDLPDGGAKKDIDVPDDAAKPKPQKPENAGFVNP